MYRAMMAALGRRRARNPVWRVRFMAVCVISTAFMVLLAEEKPILEAPALHHKAPLLRVLAWAAFPVGISAIAITCWFNLDEYPEFWGDIGAWVNLAQTFLLIILLSLLSHRMLINVIFKA